MAFHLSFREQKVNHRAFVKYASVILDVSIDKALDYGVTLEHADQIRRGVRVEVPLRSGFQTGYILEVKDIPNFTPVKSIAKVVSSGEIITDNMFELALWMARYYCTPLRQVLKTIIPASLRTPTQPKQQLFVMRSKTREQLMSVCQEIRNRSPSQAAVLDVMLQVKKGILLTELLEQSKAPRSSVKALADKGLLSLDIIRIDRSPLVNEQYFPVKAKILNSEQIEALQKITNGLENNRFETHLLHGVTGSGKTEVYLQAIETARRQDKGTIMLVPEIALTAQTIERFRSRFDKYIAVLHHRLSHGERCDEWHRLMRGEASIVIGARSAIFSPVQNLGLLIVDEEHEHSYKQSDEMPCYHARDIAVMRGKLSKGVVILGSATPSIESYYNASHGKYYLSKLSARADEASMPKVHIVDMKREFEIAKGFTNFSELLIEAIKKRLERGEQTILFLNRRGYHSSLFCQACRTPVKCQHCDASLTFHLGDNTLACHLCGFILHPPPKNCLSCHQQNLMRFSGVGTELIEKSLHALFPNIRTIRIDADTTRHKGSHQKLFRAFSTGKADVLIGTQMVAKGLHFPQVTLVGVLNSDNSLNIPDFRASETVFQLITQVSGRSGRGQMAGEVIVQTSMPDNRTIQLAAKQDYEQFYSEECSVRESFGYPPYQQMAKLTFSSKNQMTAQTAAEKWRQGLLSSLAQQFELHPVVAAGHAKVKDKYRYQFLVRGPSIYPLTRALEQLQQQIKSSQDTTVRIDINPVSTFF